MDWLSWVIFQVLKINIHTELVDATVTKLPARVIQSTVLYGHEKKLAILL